MLHSTVLPLPPFLLLLACFVRLRQINPFRVFGELDKVTRRHFQVLSLCCLLMIILNVTHTFMTTSEITLSLIFDCVLQVMGWCVCFIIITKECYRLTFWPGRLIKSYLISSLVCLVALAIVEASGKQNMIRLIQLCALFLVLVVANVVAFLKDYMMSAQDVAKLELDRACVLDYEYEDSANQRRSTAGYIIDSSQYTTI